MDTLVLLRASLQDQNVDILIVSYSYSSWSCLNDSFPNTTTLTHYNATLQIQAQSSRLQQLQNWLTTVAECYMPTNSLTSFVLSYRRNWLHINIKYRLICMLAKFFTAYNWPITDSAKELMFFAFGGLTASKRLWTDVVNFFRAVGCVNSKNRIRFWFWCLYVSRAGYMNFWRISLFPC